MKPVPVPLLGLAAVCLLTLSVGTRAPEAGWTVTLRDDSIRIITNPKGPALGYSVTSGVKILTVNGLAFKDLNKNGTLDTYEEFPVWYTSGCKGRSKGPVGGRVPDWGDY